MALSSSHLDLHPSWSFVTGLSRHYIKGKGSILVAQSPVLTFLRSSLGHVGVRGAGSQDCSGHKYSWAGIQG